MIPGNLFRLELAAAFANRRRMLLRIAIIVLLGMPFIFVSMPIRAKTAGVIMVIIFTGFFGSAVNHAKLRSDLRYSRLILLPMPRGLLWLDLALASTFSRLAPTIVILAGFVVVNAHNMPVHSIASLGGLLCMCLFLLTVLGMIIGSLARSNGEVHLFGALVCAVLALVSGLAPVPERLGWLLYTMPWNPIARLLALLRRLAGDLPDAPDGGVIFALFALVFIVATSVTRWICGGVGTEKFLDSSKDPANNETRSKEIVE